ncbi:MAG: hypothetical protein LBM20_04405 [Rikenellaceae bacterium]|jgi:hypothetical protein|nr:hypothetical protein [Rikenellaceae bacterium]
MNLLSSWGIPIIATLLATVVAHFVIEWYKEQRLKKVSLKTCRKKAKETVKYFKEVGFEPTLIWGFRWNGGGVAKLMRNEFNNCKEIGIITTNTKKSIKNGISLEETVPHKILVILGKECKDEELALLEDIKIEINKINEGRDTEKSEIKICSLVKRTEETEKKIEEKVGQKIDYTLFNNIESENAIKTQFPWDFDADKTAEEKREDRKSWFLVSIITLFILVLLFAIFSPQKVKIGIAPYDVNNEASLEEMLEQNLIDYANESMWELDALIPPFKFDVKVNPAQNYQEVLDDVRDGDTDIAFLSSYLCALNDIPSNMTGKNASIKIIGYMKEGYTDIYKSWLIANRKGFKDGVTIEDILCGIKKGEITVCLNEIEESGSTHIVPKMYLLEHGINTLNNSIKVLYMQKSDMMQYLERHPNSVGFISSSEYLKQFMPTTGTTHSWFVHHLEYPLPRDIIVANKEWWEKIEVRSDTAIITEALSRGDIKSVPKTDGDTEKRNKFKVYIESGVLYDKSNPDSLWVVKLDNKWWNITLDSVALVKFKIFDNNVRMDTIGYGLINKNLSDTIHYEYLLDIKDKLLRNQIVNSKEAIHVVNLKAESARKIITLKEIFDMGASYRQYILTATQVKRAPIMIVSPGENQTGNSR